MIKIHDTLKEICAEYYNISPVELDKRIKESSENFIKEWNEKKSIINFYEDTAQYVYDLLNFNDDFRLNTVLYPLMFYKNKKVLDYGGGIGIISTFLSSNNIVHYYDINKESKTFATYVNKKLKGTVNFVDTEEEAFKQELDCIICVDVLEHLEKPMDTVKKITKKLSKDGLFLTTGLNFSVGAHIPMHLEENRKYLKEYTVYMNENYRPVFSHSTCNEVIFLWSKK